VIASDVGGNSTLIDAGEEPNGVLIARGDNKALARNSVALLKDPGRARGMGERARRKIATRFSIDAMVTGMEQVYAEMVERGRSGG